MVSFVILLSGIQRVLHNFEGTVVSSSLNVSEVVHHELFVIGLCQSCQGVLSFLTVFGRDSCCECCPQGKGNTGPVSVGKVAESMYGLEAGFRGRVVERLLKHGLCFL